MSGALWILVILAWFVLGLSQVLRAFGPAGRQRPRTDDEAAYRALARLHAAQCTRG